LFLEMKNTNQLTSILNGISKNKLKKWKINLR